MLRNNYVQAAIRTAPNLKKDNEALVLAAVGIAGEAIEVFEVTIAEHFSVPALVRELGDVCWYMALACFASDISFSSLYVTDVVAHFQAEGFGNRKEALNAHTGVLLVSAKNVSEFLKKQVFHHHPEDRVMLTSLLHKLMRSIQVMAAWANLPIDEVLKVNIDKLMARYPERFTTEASLNKDETKE